MQPTARHGQVTATRTPGKLDSPVILLVTNDSSWREVCARGLAGDGYTVITAAHAGHAMLACLETPRIDVLAVELSMEDLSGPALAARLRRHCPNMGAVYFANAGTPECDGVLVRPFSREDFLAALAVARPASSLRIPTSAS